MTTATKKKLCWNCEGRVGFSEEHCPFCGVYLSPTTIPGESNQDESQNQAPEPPYQVDQGAGNPIDPSPYSTPQQEQEAQPAKAKFEVNEEFRQMITPMGTLLAGSIFFLFGLVLLLFSHDGKLTLQWSSDYWYVYLVFSLAMLFWGWRSLQWVDE